MRKRILSVLLCACIGLSLLPVAFAVTYYTIAVRQTDNGTVQIDSARSSSGKTITLTVNPDKGYQMTQLFVTADKTGEALSITQEGNRTYTFSMPPSNATVMAYFNAKPHICHMADFTDLDPDEWYHPGIDFVVEEGLMEGIGDGLFGPAETTTRAMVVATLYRMEGSPEAPDFGFADVEPDSWYEDAVNWSVSAGISKGTTDRRDPPPPPTFSPNEPITREQIATILYRYAQTKGLGYDREWTFRMDFPDVGSLSAFAYEAMSWMNMMEIIIGADPNADGNWVLLPQNQTTRAEIATMLMRFCDALEEQLP